MVKFFYYWLFAIRRGLPALITVSVHLSELTTLQHASRRFDSLPWWCVGGCSAGCVGCSASSSVRGTGSAVGGGTSCFRCTTRTRRQLELWGTDHSWSAEPHTCTATLTNSTRLIRQQPNTAYHRWKSRMCIFATVSMKISWGDFSPSRKFKKNLLIIFAFCHLVP